MAYLQWMLSLLLSCRIIEIRAHHIPYDVMTVTVLSAEVSISWKCNDPTRSNEYAVAYTLTNKDQCYALDGFSIEQQTVWENLNCVYDASNIASCWMLVYELSPYSIYTYYVKSRVQGSTYQSTANNFRTDEAAPTDFPAGIKNSIERNTKTSLFFAFRNIPCGRRRGQNNYESEVRCVESRNKKVQCLDTKVIPAESFHYIKGYYGTVVFIDDLQCNTSYSFRVRGSNGNGELDGPYSSLFMGETSLCAPSGIDTIRPVVSCPPDITATALPWFNYAEVTYAPATATDNSGGVVQLTYWADGRPTDGHPTATSFYVGQTAVTVFGRDPSDNLGQCTFFVTVVESSASSDTIRPVVSCPPNQQATALPGVQSTNVTLNAPATATDNSGEVVQLTYWAYGHPTAKFFTVGQTAVTVTGRDSSGNTGKCTFFVTVVESSD
ncbi:uncharacterized protein [Amphiura filiformis]|uniref:uncharacterized protein n=1 Tax=Amphiura filiformis TaxID=82378 RepID=UPI003B21DDA7